MQFDVGVGFALTGLQVERSGEGDPAHVLSGEGDAGDALLDIEAGEFGKRGPEGVGQGEILDVQPLAGHRNLALGQVARDLKRAPVVARRDGDGPAEGAAADGDPGRGRQERADQGEREVLGIEADLYRRARGGGPQPEHLRAALFNLRIKGLDAEPAFRLRIGCLMAEADSDGRQLGELAVGAAYGQLAQGQGSVRGDRGIGGQLETAGVFESGLAEAVAAAEPAEEVEEAGGDRAGGEAEVGRGRVLPDGSRGGQPGGESTGLGDVGDQFIHAPQRGLAADGGMDRECVLRKVEVAQPAGEAVEVNVSLGVRGPGIRAEGDGSLSGEPSTRHVEVRAGEAHVGRHFESGLGAGGNAVEGELQAVEGEVEGGASGCGRGL
ncbi:MAG: hypothetical protein BWZ02_03142 [Lentisphaerae bacterium ADurb.BinA184]|nr:MAG: hypothetical protein BWZ02_03142 [Lentisphaerae bacterium ADurb.BinA184]